jgi:hypothetical protein
MLAAIGPTTRSTEPRIVLAASLGFRYDCSSEKRARYPRFREGALTNQAAYISRTEHAVGQGGGRIGVNFTPINNQQLVFIHKNAVKCQQTQKKFNVIRQSTKLALNATKKFNHQSPGVHWL